ncbi:MAG TPA: hypothetical protein VGC64_10115, partial [Pyrinomonadaceae bacterium]
MSRERLRLILSALACVILLCAAATTLTAQQAKHEMKNMPGMEMKKPAPQAKPRPKRKAAVPPKQEEMPGMQMKETPAASPEPEATPQAKPLTAPAPVETKMPDMQMPAATQTPAPAKMEMPMPSTTPAIVSTPQPPVVEKDSGGAEQTNDDTGGGQKPAGAMDAMPGMKHDSMPGMDMSKEKGMSGIPTTDSLSLMVMSGREMSIRVGTSVSNKLSMSQMGSGTSWQPGTTPMSMFFKYAKGWLLFLHGEAKLG